MPQQLYPPTNLLVVFFSAHLSCGAKIFKDNTMTDYKRKPLTALVTGFGPFGRHKVNSSWEAVRALPSLGPLTVRGEDVHLEVRLLQVDYGICREEVPKLWSEIQPDVVVHVGVSPSRVVKLEKYGCNIGYNSPDINFTAPVGGCVRAGGPDIIESPLDLDRVRRQVLFKQGDVKIELSFNAGQYLCDYIYYTSLYLNKGPVLFVHVPSLDEPYSQPQLTETIRNIIEILLFDISLKRETEAMESSGRDTVLKLDK